MNERKQATEVERSASRLQHTSLKARLGLFAIIIPLFLVATSVVLYFSYQQSLERSYLDRMTVQLYSLLGNAEPIPTSPGIWLPEELQDTRFNQVQSGLAAWVIKGEPERQPSEEDVVWQSASMVGLSAPPTSDDLSLLRVRAMAQPGTVVTDSGHAGRLLKAVIAVRFSEADTQAYFFEIFQNAEFIHRESRQFVTSLVVGMTLVTLGLAVVSLLMMRWLMNPIRQLTVEIKEVEGGYRETVSENFPPEIARFSRALNTLLSAEKQQRERFRNSLGDLAHSLKTPLAILRGLIDREASAPKTSATPSNAELLAQVDRINQAISYQLNRTASSPLHGLQPALPLAPACRRLIESMEQLYGERGIVFGLTEASNRLLSQASLRVKVSEGDLLEILGNLLDNGGKYADTQVALHIQFDSAQHQVTFTVLDDGPGIPVERWNDVLQRGLRLDSRPIGQGIGLAVVKDLVASYRGRLTLIASDAEREKLAELSELGEQYPGAWIRFSLPG